MGGSDKRLVRRAARGDQRAFEEIYRRYHPDLYRFCLAMTGNQQDAQDALQNTMVKMLRALPGEERQIALKPWLYRIARNETVEVLRKRRYGDELTLEHAMAGTVVETAETREHLRALLNDLEQLPQRQRAVLLMRELAGLGFAEIGTAFETSPAVARQTLYEARLNLRQLEEGRERRCADVRKELSDADGRVVRRRKTRAHLRSCRDCRDFYEVIVKRHADLAAIATLPLAAAVGLLRDALGGYPGSGGGAAVSGSGIGGAIAVVVGKGVATPTLVKSVATVAVAAVAVSAADDGGLVDLRRDRGDEVVALHAPAPHAAPIAASDQSVRGMSAAAPGAPAAQTPDPQAGSRNQSQASGDTQPPAPVAAQLVVQNPNQSDDETPVTPGTGASADAGVGDPPASPSNSSSADRSAPEAGQNGSPAGPAEPSNHGQQTVAARKPTSTASPPGHASDAEKSARRSSPSGPPRGKREAPPGKRTGQTDDPGTPAEASEAPVESPEESPGKSGGALGRSGEAGHGHSNSGHGH